MATDEWQTALREQREQKAAYFADNPRSPVLAAHRGDQFPGLDHYDVDPEYRFVAPLEEHDGKEQITVGTTADGEQEYVDWGAFSVTVDGESVTLEAFRPADGSDRFWVPFRDDTNGEETYPAGRYLDLEPDTHRTDDGWILDFNEAYNPTCAYNPQYECPLVPTENWLDVRVEAGEKQYPGHDDVDAQHG